MANAIKEGWTDINSRMLGTWRIAAIALFVASQVAAELDTSYPLLFTSFQEYVNHRYCVQ
jgi:hypothetical protein